MGRWLRILTGIAICALLAACGGGESPTDATPTAVSTPLAESSPTAPAQPMVIGQIIWAEETDATTGAPVNQVTGFTTESPAIVAVVEVTNLPAGTQFTAAWTLNDSTITDSPMTVVAQGDMTHAWISFRFTRDGERRYPLGQVGVTITASDGTMREATVEIGFP